MKSLLKKLIALALAPMLAMPAAAQTPDARTAPAANQRVLVVVTNHADYPSRTDKTGLWLTEFTHFWDELEAAGVPMDIVSPKGGKSPLDQRSLEAGYTDDAARAHLRDAAFMDRLAHTKAAADIDPKGYGAIYFTGGHGTMWDFRNAPDLKRLAEAIHAQGGVVSAVCHGNAALVQLQGADGQPLIRGKRVTGFSNFEERLAGVRDQVPFFLQDALVETGAQYEKALVPFKSHVVTDGRLVTGQNPNSSKAVAQQVLGLLQGKTVAAAR